jgi:branched-chain amino acid transport system permease protein
MDATLIQVILSGVLVGAVYGLAALGLSLAFGVLKVLNVAHGALIMLGGYVTFYLFTLLAIDPYISMGIVLIVLALFGLLLYGLVFRHIIRLDEENRIKNSLLIGFGLVLILQTAAVRVFSGDERSVVTSYSSTAWEIGDIRVPVIRLSGLLLAIVAVILLERFLTRTYLGKALRATSEDWATASLTGIDIRRIYLIAFAIATGLAGITGVIIVVGFSINPDIGLYWTLKALIVVVLAGLGSMRGTLLGGILLGVAEALSAYLFGGEYRELVGLLIFLVILSVRPEGLFGAKRG